MFRFTKPKNNVDIDVRFLLANERTLLSWIRTGLTLIAGGVAVTFISPLPRYGTLAGIGAVLFGGLLAAVGYIRYQLADRAIRNGQLPPTGVASLVVVIAVMIFAVLIVIAQSIGK